MTDTQAAALPRAFRPSSPRRALMIATSSNLGDNISLFAVPWLLTGFTRSAVLIALASVVGRAPGALARYWTPRLVGRGAQWAMRCSCVVRVVVLGVLSAGYVWLTGTQEVILYVFMAAVGITDTLFDTALDAHVAGLRLASRELARLNGEIRTAELICSDFVGRPVGSVLLRLTPVLPFVVNLVTSALTALFMALPMTETGNEQPDTPTARIATASDAGGETTDADTSGVTVRRVAAMRGLIAVRAWLTAVYSALLAVQVLYARVVLHADSTWFAVLLVVAAFGSIASARVAGLIVHRFGYRATALVMIFVMAAAFVGQGLARSVAAAVPAYVAGGFAVTCWAVSATTVRQLLCPAGLRAQFAARAQATTTAAALLGMLAGGVAVSLASQVVAERSALWAAFVVGGVAVAVVGVVAGRPLGIARSLVQADLER